MQLPSNRRSLAWLSTSILMLLLTSCGSSESIKLYPVHGKVLMDDKPPDGAMLILYAVNPSTEVSKLSKAPSARVKADGTFSIGTLMPEDGAPAGDYKIGIEWFPPDARSRMAESSEVTNLMPSIYGDPKTSGLQVQVKAEPNEVPVLQLKSRK